MPTKPATYRGPAGTVRRPKKGPRHYDRRSWRKTSQRKRAKDPICEICGERLTSQVDHIRPIEQGGEDRDANLRSTCDECHGRITRHYQETGINELPAGGPTG